MFILLSGDLAGEAEVGAAPGNEGQVDGANDDVHTVGVHR